MARQWMLMALAGAALVVAGCDQGGARTVDGGGAATPTAPRMMELVAQSQPPIPDLPVPVGFKLDEGRSRNFAAGGMRWVDHVYTGSDDRFAVARFYKRQMPINRWTLMKDMFVQGDIILEFEKESERCQLIIAKGGMFDKSEIKIQLWTSGRIMPPAAPKR